MNGFIVDQGDRVKVELLWVNAIQRKVRLNLLELVEEDAGDLFD